MKKIALILLFGLVSIANAESICKKANQLDEIFDSRADSVAKLMANYVIKREVDEYKIDYENRLAEKVKYYESILVDFYAKEFKASSKESICAYMISVDTAFLNTKLTPQEIGRLEQFLIKKDEYTSYEGNKDYYLMALKFLKYHKMIEQYYKMDNRIVQLVNGLIYLIDKHGEMKFERFVYGKSMGNIYFGNNSKFDSLKAHISGNNCENKADTKDEAEQCKALKSIVQWAESILNKSKQKGAK